MTRDKPKISLCTSLAALLLLAAVGRVHAAPPDTVSFRAVCFDPRETQTPVFYVSHNGKVSALELNKGALSKPQTAPVRDGKFVDFMTSQDPQARTAPVTLTLPNASPGELVVVFVPGEKGYRTWPVQVPAAQFKGGTTLIINASSAEVATKLAEDKSVAVPGGGVKVLPLPSGFNEPMIPVQIFSRAKAADPWRIEQSSRWPVDQNFRTFLFFYHDPAAKRLKLQAIGELIKP
jgi:hypothetical protein